MRTWFLAIVVLVSVGERVYAKGVVLPDRRKEPEIERLLPTVDKVPFGIGQYGAAELPDWLNSTTASKLDFTANYMRSTQLLLKDGVLEVLPTDHDPAQTKEWAERVRQATAAYPAGGFRLVHKTLAGDPVVKTVESPEEAAALATQWLDAGDAGHRRLLLPHAMVVIDVDAKAPERRASVLDRTSLQMLVHGFAETAKADPSSAGSQLRGLVSSIDSAFAALGTQGLFDDASQAASIAWRVGVRPRALDGQARLDAPEAALLAASFESITVAFAIQAQNLCAVTVQTSEPDAEIRHAKASEAQKDPTTWEQIGPSTAFRTLERAKRVFKSFRNGMETGSAVGDCTSKTATVTIFEKKK